MNANRAILFDLFMLHVEKKIENLRFYRRIERKSRFRFINELLSLIELNVLTKFHAHEKSNYERDNVMRAYHNLKRFVDVPPLLPSPTVEV